MIICLRGVTGGVDTEHMRNRLDVGDIAIFKQKTHLPVWYDPSHSTGRKDLVETVALQAIVGGADGLIIDVNTHPNEAMVDGAQALLPSEFEHLMESITAAANVVGRNIFVPKKE